MSWDILSLFVGLLLVLSPTEDDKILNKIYEDPPYVYILSQEKFQELFCQCECNVVGLYLGDVINDNKVRKTIFLSGYEDIDGNIFVDPVQILHELVHYKQDIEGKINENNKLSLKEQNVGRVQLENEAYNVQNIFTFLNNGVIIDIKSNTKNSVNWALGTSSCSSNFLLSGTNWNDLRKIITEENKIWGY